MAGAQHPPMGPQIRPDPNAHPRDVAMEAAGKELVEFLNSWTEKHPMSMIEYAYLLAVPMHRQLQAMCLAEREQQPAKKESP